MPPAAGQLAALQGTEPGQGHLHFRLRGNKINIYIVYIVSFIIYIRLYVVVCKHRVYAMYYVALGYATRYIVYYILHYMLQNLVKFRYI